MFKRGFLTCFLLFFIIAGCFAQERYLQNPFSKLSFLKNTADTIILVSFYGINDDIGLSNKDIIHGITNHTGKKIKGLRYAIDIKIGSYPLLHVACSDKRMFSVLKNDITKSTQIKIHCKVYRFYFFDGTCNFFYVNQVDLI